MKKFLLFIFLIFFCINSYAQFVKVKITPLKKEIYLGDRVKFIIKVTSDKEIKRFKVYDRDIKICKKEKNEIYFCFFKQFFKTGKIEIPPVKLNINGMDVYSNKLIIYVKSNLKKDSKFYDVKPPEKVKFYLTKNEIIVLIVLLILLIILILLIVKFYRRKRIKTTNVSQFDFDYLLPYEEAIKNIQKCESFIEKGDLKSFYSHLSYTLRRFLDRKKKLTTLELTIDEIIDKYKDELNRDIINFLKKCDEIRFSGDFPEFSQIKKDFEELKKIVKDVENSQS